MLFNPSIFNSLVFNTGTQPEPSVRGTGKKRKKDDIYFDYDPTIGEVARQKKLRRQNEAILLLTL